MKFQLTNWSTELKTGLLDWTTYCKMVRVRNLICDIFANGDRRCNGWNNFSVKTTNICRASITISGSDFWTANNNAMIQIHAVLRLFWVALKLELVNCLITNNTKRTTLMSILERIASQKKSRCAHCAKWDTSGSLVFCQRMFLDHMYISKFIDIKLANSF